MAALRPSPLSWSSAHCPVAALALPLVGLLAWALAATSRAALPPGGQVYTVAQITDHLFSQPAAWVGRTVRVQGQFGLSCDAWSDPASSARCVSWELGLVDPGPAVRHQILPLVPDDAPPIVVSLRRLPLLGLLAPSRPTPVLGRIAVYRVRLQLVLCGPPPQCIYQGVLV